ncbi:ATP-binding cassette domain-containing protein [Curvibacter sp. HBC61]|uniref:ATP-binding cassette domain-containing protein n=1 Tax=Curvibacter cyanobacteriorum TaxID=3026422 RepID=A0ABT5MX44_9BURK|nr:ATP-binding cassette domain-containing protein [Curvibacter sp. HBC61]MDD0838585.1 ATP-binding cassette domain-containing protein [Curvibacter sp. HBC61]
MLGLEQLAVSVRPPQVLLRCEAALQVGRVTAVLGPNGAGKSSLLAVLSGLKAPWQGRVTLDGRPLGGWSPSALARQRAVMLQEHAVAFEHPVSEVVALGRFAHQRQPSRHESAIVPAALAAMGVATLGARRYASLSGGEKARVQWARALAQIWEPVAAGGARWLLLDEPTAALDLAHQHACLGWLRAWARAQSVGVVVVLHDLNLALRYSDDVLLLPGAAEPQARAWFGATEAVLTPERVRQVWGVAVQEAAPAAPGPGHPPCRQMVFGPA